MRGLRPAGVVALGTTERGSCIGRSLVMVVAGVAVSTTLAVADPRPHQCFTTLQAMHSRGVLDATLRVFCALGFGIAHVA